MKVSKKMLPAVLGIALIIGFFPVNSFSKPKKGQKSAIERLREFFEQEEATERKNAPTETVSPSVSENTETAVSTNSTDKTAETANEETQKETTEAAKKTFVCGKETITVEFSDGEKVILTDGKGKAHELVNTKAASGELYSNKEGVSIHMKGNEGVYTSSSKSKDVSCELSK